MSAEEPQAENSQPKPRRKGGDDGDHSKGHGGGHGGGGHGGGGGGHDEGEHEGAPEWLISFADNTALMMGFFVIMLALSMAPKGSAGAADEASSEAAKASGQSTQALDWAIGVREAFNNPVDEKSDKPGDRFLAMRLRERKRGQAVDPGVVGEHDKSQSLRTSEYQGLVATVAFTERLSTLDAKADQTIADFAAKVRGLRLIIEVCGHASATADSTDQSSAQMLSFDRAVAVADALVKHGLDRKQLRLVACGDSEPLRWDAYSSEGLRANERVEIIVIERVMQP